MSIGTPTRITPLGKMSPFRAQRIWERNYYVSRRIWKLIFSGFFEPIFYLFSIGVGLGALAGQVEGPGGAPIDYTAFVAPALLAASAMNGAVMETTFNVFFKLKFDKTYDGMLATPLRSSDLAIGEIGWALIRGLIYSSAFMIVMLAMGLLDSWLAILAIPGAFLVGLAFGAAGLAATTYMTSWQDFDLVNLVTLPLFLFSGTFYPIDLYPPLVRQVASLSPLYHGTELIRGFTMGVTEWTMLVHVGFLLAMALICGAVANRRFDLLLRK